VDKVSGRGGGDERREGARPLVSSPAGLGTSERKANCEQVRGFCLQGSYASSEDQATEEYGSTVQGTAPERKSAQGGDGRLTGRGGTLFRMKGGDKSVEADHGLVAASNDHGQIKRNDV